MHMSSTLQIHPEERGRTPALLGVNMEIQEHADEANLWDWLADSGAGVARELTPQAFLRPEGYVDPRWERIVDRPAFDHWRRRVRNDPQTEIPPESIRMDEPVPWLGTPARFLAKLRETGVEPVISVDYNPRSYHLPLVKDPDTADPQQDDDLNWPACAAAYAYAVALLYRTVRDFGVRYAACLNEPENRFDWFELPADLREALGDHPWFTVSKGSDRSIAERYLTVVARQSAVLTRLIRTAAEDVSAVLGVDRPRILGPVNVAWKHFWDFAAPWLDSLDVHHYSPDPLSFDRLYAAVRNTVTRHNRTAGRDPRSGVHADTEAGTARADSAAPARSFSLSEFNRFSGGTDILHSPLNPDTGVEVADLLFTVCALGRRETPCDVAAFYLFNAPSTHRNHKHLLYGDLNVLDWSGSDRALWNRSGSWYPSAAQLQVRHPTLAYVVFRMLARACRPHDWSTGEVSPHAGTNEVSQQGSAEEGSQRVEVHERSDRAGGGPQEEPPDLRDGGHGEPQTAGPYPVLADALRNDESADPRDLSYDTRVLTVRQPKALFVHVLNPHIEPRPNFRVDLSMLAPEYAGAVVRTASSGAAGSGAGTVDEQVRLPVSMERDADWMIRALTVDLPPRSCTQLILTAEDWQTATDLRISESTLTPGVLRDLRVTQTTRLRLFATLRGQPADLTELNAWFCCKDDSLLVTSTGLVERLRLADHSPHITAGIVGADEGAWVSVGGRAVRAD